MSSPGVGAGGGGMMNPGLETGSPVISAGTALAAGFKFGFGTGTAFGDTELGTTPAGVSLDAAAPGTMSFGSGVIVIFGCPTGISGAEAGAPFVCPDISGAGAESLFIGSGAVGVGILACPDPPIIGIIGIAGAPPASAKASAIIFP